MPKSVLLEELFRLMELYKFQSNKKKSQHFLVNPKAVEELVNAAHVSKKDTVLEIGSGTGFITRALLNTGAKVIACELDETFCTILSRELPQENLQIVQGNFLKVKVPTFNKVCSAPPYSISSEIMERLFEARIDGGALLFQREFVERLNAIPGVSDYSALSVLAQHYFELQPLSKYSPENFFPTPQAYSQTISFQSRKQSALVSDRAAFNQLVQQLFRYKNKNLQKAIKHAQPFLEKKLIHPEKPNLLGWAEEKVNLLEVEQFAELFKSLYD